MENVYAALLLHKLGKEVNEENVKKVVAAALGEAGQVDESKIKSLVASLKGVDIAKELESASLVAAAPVASAGAQAGAEKKEEKPKEEKKEAAAEGLSALFG
ncbi:MAG: 50S ribosomal protein P1 [Nanoarchaeota archaeon]|nr:50S ribosomal protein P1 [Nanoarchaeota archaeon]